MTVRWRVALAAVVLAAAGCETLPEESYVAQRPATAQRLPAYQGSYHQVRRGETLWRIAHAYGLSVDALAGANRISPKAPLEVNQKLFIPLPAETKRFLWPVRGAMRPSTSQGVDIAAAAGSLVRASRSGRVAVATRHLGGWGRTIVLDHADGYLTVYAGLDQILVPPAASLRQGMPLGTAGSRALHFEIRFGSAPRNTLALLPRDR
jgi:murein DD-endopeptidase MepM/ murein hydrolase activator NlpD